MYLNIVETEAREGQQHGMAGKWDLTVPVYEYLGNWP
jgi:hypothetical protein